MLGIVDERRARLYTHVPLDNVFPGMHVVHAQVAEYVWHHFTLQAVQVPPDSEKPLLQAVQVQVLAL